MTGPPPRRSAPGTPDTPGPDERTLTTMATITTSAERSCGYVSATAETAVSL
jgi:hypothetical protein